MMLFIVFVGAFLYLILKMSAAYSANSGRNKRTREYYGFEKERLKSLKEKYSRERTVYSDKRNRISVTSSEYQDHEIVNCYNDYVGFGENAYLKEKAAAANRIVDDLEQIFKDAVSSGDELAYLRDKEDQLQKLSSKYDELIKDNKGRVIVITGTSDCRWNELNDLFDAIRKSRKLEIETDGTDFKVKRRPSDLAIFKTEYDPIMIRIKNSCFCIFANTILAFDSKGIFMNAYTLDSLKITYSVLSERVSEKDGYRWDDHSSWDSYMSKKVSEKSYWDYQTKDGSADRRYKNNSHHNELVGYFDYADVEISLADYSCSFTASSYRVLRILSGMKKAIRKS